MINGWVADRIGFKKTMIGALGFVTCFIFIVFFVQSIEMLLVGLILMGIPWGVFQTLTTTVSSLPSANSGQN
jgi:SP family general alpha glucoside:H+ symporter-like MFS transporter